MNSQERMGNPENNERPSLYDALEKAQQKAKGEIINFDEFLQKNKKELWDSESVLKVIEEIGRNSTIEITKPLDVWLQLIYRLIGYTQRSDLKLEDCQETLREVLLSESHPLSIAHIRTFKNSFGGVSNFVERLQPYIDLESQDIVDEILYLVADTSNVDMSKEESIPSRIRYIFNSYGVSYSDKIRTYFNNDARPHNKYVYTPKSPELKAEIIEFYEDLGISESYIEMGLKEGFIAFNEVVAFYEKYKDDSEEAQEILGDNVTDFFERVKNNLNPSLTSRAISAGKNVVTNMLNRIGTVHPVDHVIIAKPEENQPPENDEEMIPINRNLAPFVTQNIEAELAENERIGYSEVEDEPKRVELKKDEQKIGLTESYEKYGFTHDEILEAIPGLEAIPSNHRELILKKVLYSMKTAFEREQEIDFRNNKYAGEMKNPTFVPKMFNKLAKAKRFFGVGVKTTIAEFDGEAQDKLKEEFKYKMGELVKTYQETEKTAQRDRLELERSLEGITDESVRRQLIGSLNELSDDYLKLGPPKEQNLFQKMGKKSFWKELGKKDFTDTVSTIVNVPIKATGAALNKITTIEGRAEIAKDIKAAPSKIKKFFGLNDPFQAKEREKISFKELELVKLVESLEGKVPDTLRAEIMSDMVSAKSAGDFMRMVEVELDHAKKNEYRYGRSAAYAGASMSLGYLRRKIIGMTTDHVVAWTNLLPTMGVGAVVRFALASIQENARLNHERTHEMLGMEKDFEKAPGYKGDASSIKDTEGKLYKKGLFAGYARMMNRGKDKVIEAMRKENITVGDLINQFEDALNSHSRIDRDDYFNKTIAQKRIQDLYEIARIALENKLITFSSEDQIYGVAVDPALGKSNIGNRAKEYLKLNVIMNTAYLVSTYSDKRVQVESITNPTQPETEEEKRIKAVKAQVEAIKSAKMKYVAEKAAKQAGVSAGFIALGALLGLANDVFGQGDEETVSNSGHIQQEIPSNEVKPIQLRDPDSFESDYVTLRKQGIKTDLEGGDTIEQKEIIKSQEAATGDALKKSAKKVFSDKSSVDGKSDLGAKGSTSVLDESADQSLKIEGVKDDFDDKNISYSDDFDTDAPAGASVGDIKITTTSPNSLEDIVPPVPPVEDISVAPGVSDTQNLQNEYLGQTDLDVEKLDLVNKTNALIDKQNLQEAQYYSQEFGVNNTIKTGGEISYSDDFDSEDEVVDIDPAVTVKTPALNEQPVDDLEELHQFRANPETRSFGFDQEGSLPHTRAISPFSRMQVGEKVFGLSPTQQEFVNRISLEEAMENQRRMIKELSGQLIDEDPRIAGDLLANIKKGVEGSYDESSALKHVSTPDEILGYTSEASPRLPKNQEAWNKIYSKLRKPQEYSRMADYDYGVTNSFDSFAGRSTHAPFFFDSGKALKVEDIFRPRTGINQMQVMNIEPYMDKAQGDIVRAINQKLLNTNKLIHELGKDYPSFQNVNSKNPDGSLTQFGTLQVQTLIKETYAYAPGSADADIKNGTAGVVRAAIPPEFMVLNHDRREMRLGIEPLKGEPIKNYMLRLYRFEAYLEQQIKLRSLARARETLKKK